MTDKLTGSMYAIEAPQFSAGLVMAHKRVTSASPMVRFMQGWSEERVKQFCEQKGYTLHAVPIVDRRFGPDSP